MNEEATPISEVEEQTFAEAAAEEAATWHDTAKTLRFAMIARITARVVLGSVAPFVLHDRSAAPPPGPTSAGAETAHRGVKRLVCCLRNYSATREIDHG